VGAVYSALGRWRSSGLAGDAKNSYHASYGGAQGALAGFVAGAIVMGPPGALAGGVMGACGATAVDGSYLGEPRSWTQFDSLSQRGEKERCRWVGEKQDLTEEDFLRQRDVQTESAMKEFVGEETKVRVGFAGSGGGLRAAVAFLAFIAEADKLGLPATWITATSGSCWSTLALYANDIDEETCLNPELRLEELRSRLSEGDLRKPCSKWLSAPTLNDDEWVHSRFAARVAQGHDLGAANVAHGAVDARP
jgi:hypothetical protein